MRFVPDLHRSTYVVLLLTAIALFFAIVPGSDRLVLVPADCRMSRGHVADGFDQVHGWPWIYLGRDWFFLPGTGSGFQSSAVSVVPRESPWALHQAVLWFHVGYLLADLLVAAVILVAVAAAFEFRRRRHARLVHLSLRELMLAVLLVALGSWWFTLEWQTAERRAQFLTRAPVQANSVSTVPLWWRNWFGEPSLPLLARVYVVRITGSIEEINAALADIDQVPEVVFVDIDISGSNQNSPSVDLTPLKELDCLQIIEVGGWPWGGGHAIAGNLSSSTRLQSLDLMADIIDPGLIESLGSCANLEVLRITDPSLPGASNWHSLKSVARCRELSVFRISSSARDEDLAWLAITPTLQELDLSNTAISDATLAEIEKLNELEELRLANCKIGDAGLERLAGSTRLNTLDLRATEITDAGLAHLARLVSLVSLNVSGTQVTNQGLAHLSGLTSLEELDLGDPFGHAIDDAGVRHLAPLRNLKSLSLAGARFTNSALQVVTTRFTQLEDLNLSRCRRIDEAGISTLCDLKNLHLLYLNRRESSPAVERHLKSALPNLRIEHWP